MFVAIVIPKAKEEHPVAICALAAIVLSCAFKYIPGLNSVPGGFSVIICAVIASAIFAFAAPIKTDEEDKK